MKVDNKKRRLHLTEEYKSEFKEILLSTCYANGAEDYLTSEAGQKDVQREIYGRMMEAESRMMPWIEEVYDVTGKSVLEIGCGTGSATIPFALRVHSIYAYDIHQASLEMAKHRAALLGVDNVNFCLLDSDWAQSEEKLKSFQESAPKVDILLMMALLEHLTIKERINVLETAWTLLKPGGIIIVYETPNRINCFDWHSFWLPFFDCLPDQLALLYSVKTPRPFFKVWEENPNEHLYRLGRGVSYHEFELALNFRDLTVINDGFSKHLQNYRSVLSDFSFAGAVIEVFRERLPHIPLGFARPSLDLIILKGRNELREKRNNEVTTEMSALQAFLGSQQARYELQQARSELEAIRNSKTWRLARKILDSPLGLLVERVDWIAAWVLRKLERE